MLALLVCFFLDCDWRKVQHEYDVFSFNPSTGKLIPDEPLINEFKVCRRCKRCSADAPPEALA